MSQPVPEPGEPRRRLTALDGVRAFAVLAVMLYHGGVSWVGGGLLGVDVFFVLSGFLITSLLCRELVRTGSVRLRAFWARRARRLLPALLILLLGVAAYAHFLAGSIDVASVRGDAIATLLYVANWHFVLSDQGYFVQSAAPSPLLHTWSLAVEEQYYLVWPLIALFVYRRGGARALALVAGVGAVASAVLMASMHAAGFSLNLLYYGTDTRAQALLVGSFLGAVGAHRGESLRIIPERWVAAGRGRQAWTALGLCGSAFLVWAWHGLAGQDPFLYEGGFFLVAIAAGAVLISCVDLPRSPVHRLCALPPLVFVGRISYGLYLYHWPLFLVIDHARTGLLGFPLLAVRLAASFAAATLSFYLVEQPVRTRRLFHAPMAAGVATAVAAVVTAMALVGATIAPAVAEAAPRSSARLTAAQRTALTKAHAFGDHPVRFLLLGDSVALTLGIGLSEHSVPRYGVKVMNEAIIGCELDDVPVRLTGSVGPATPGCIHWRTVWPQDVATYRPEVVGLLIGRWEVSDHLYRGHWVHVGDRGWDDHLVAELDQAVAIFTARGAKVALFTMPYVDPPTEAATGKPFPEDDPARARAFDALLDRVAADHRQSVTVVDLNRLLDPHGHFQSVIDGLTVRWPDGIHISVAGGEWLQPSILPTVGQLGLAVRQARAG